MCRTGVRHCDCSPQQREQHNKRRREARRLRTALVGLAKAAGAEPEQIEHLAGVNVTQARQWAITHLGLNADLLARQSPAVAGKWRARHRYGAGDETPAVQLVNQIGNALASEPTQGRAADLRNGDVLWTDSLDDDQAGVNTTLRVEMCLHDGERVTGYAKPFDGCDMDTAGYYCQESEMGPVHEVAASRLAQALGPTYAQMVPITVLKDVDGRLCSVCEHVPGEMPYDGGEVGGLADQLAAGFFDALVGQQDRHPGNLRHDPETDSIYLIDHGFAFGRKGDLLNAATVNSRRVAAHPQLLDHEREALRRLVNSSDLLGVGPLLDDGRRAALRGRAEQMLATGTVLDLGDYLDPGAFNAQYANTPSEPAAAATT